MTNTLSILDILIFFGSLCLVMFLGLWFGGKDKSADDYFLAGQSTRWWGVAGSIFGSNVSANHIVGMLGVGYSIGFAQSHFEVGAVVGLLLLCYGFLPVYKKLGITTLSEYLAQRYDERSRLVYAIIMIFIIVFVMMVPGFYIGSRSLNILISGDYQEVNHQNYVIGILAMVVITGSYTIFGGLRAVIFTDVIQSLLLILATCIVAWITFSQPEIGSWSNLMKMDKEGKDLMHLYLPMDHPDLPWTGVLSGLYVLHFYYWGANQFIVQRALSAKSLQEARVGIILAGLIKLLIPFLSIGTGIAAFYLFQQKGLVVDQDAAFTTLITQFVQPLGYGILGLVGAGLIGAILSSLDSMMNSAATIITYDIYKRHINPNADDKKLINIGKIWISILIIGAALIATLVMDPNSSDSFFLGIAKHQANLISGLVVAFALGMFWSKANANGAFAAIITGIAICYGLPWAYELSLRDSLGLEMYFGQKLNFLHTVMASTVASALVHILLSLQSPCTAPSSQLTWVGLGVHHSKNLKKISLLTLLTLFLFALTSILMISQILTTLVAAIFASTWVFSLFIFHVYINKVQQNMKFSDALKDDRIYGGIFAALGAFIMFYYY